MSDEKPENSDARQRRTVAQFEALIEANVEALTAQVEDHEREIRTLIAKRAAIEALRDEWQGV